MPSGWDHLNAVPTFANVCEICDTEFMAYRSTSLWCLKCRESGKAQKQKKLKRKYGITLDQFKEMLIKQNYMCVLCDDYPEHVDHDHRTGRVRGLLCVNCNRRMGAVDDIEWLDRALKYRTQAVDLEALRRVEVAQVSTENISQYHSGYAVKICETCSQEFRPRSPTQLCCKVCIPNKRWAAKFFRKYGLTKPMYDALMARQEGLCALCSNLATDVDHCHFNEEVRGILCVSCNSKLASLDDSKFFAKAQQYATSAKEIG